MDDPQITATEETPLTFEVKAQQPVRAAIQAVLATVPEVRSVVVIFDYFGALNDAEISKGLWLGRKDPLPLDAVFGSLMQTQRVLEEQTIHAYGQLQALRAAVVTETEQLKNLLKQKAEILDGKTSAAGSDGP